MIGYAIERKGVRMPKADDPEGSVGNILADPPEEGDVAGTPDQEPEEGLSPLSLLPPEGAEESGMPSGDAPGESDGLNVDLSQLSDEDLAALAVENPGAIRAQAMFQGHHTQRSQALSEAERVLAVERERLGQRETALNQLLEQQAQAGVQGAPQVPPQQVPPQQVPGQQVPGQQVPGQQVPPQVSLEQVQSVPELVQGLRGEVATQINSALGPTVQGLQQALQDMRTEQFRRDMDTQFAALGEKYDEVKTPAVRQRIEQQMVASSIADPEAAYLKLLGPAIEARHRQEMAAQAAQREAQPVPRGGKASRKIKGSRAAAAKLTPTQKKEEALRVAQENPDAFVMGEGEE